MKFTSLGSIADIQLGKMLSPLAQTGTAPFPYLRNQNVQWNKFDLSAIATMDFTERERKKFDLRIGDLLICEGGEPGRCAVWDGRLNNCYYQKALHRLRPQDGAADSDFLAFWIRYQALTGAFENHNSKTTIAHLPLVRLRQLPVPDIGVERQRQIAARLKAQFKEVDKARQANVAQLRATAKLADAIVFDSIRPSKAEKNSLGGVLVEVKQGIGEGWANYPVLGATRDGLAPAKEPPGKKPERYKPAFPGTVFYNPMRILIGSIALVDNDDPPGITSPDYVVLQGKEGLVDSRWFYYWLRSPLGEQCIRSLARGAVRERMLFKRLAEGKIELPTFAVQRKASTALASLKPMRQTIQAKLDEINLLPQKILAQAFAE